MSLRNKKRFVWFYDYDASESYYCNKLHQPTTFHTYPMTNFIYSNGKLNDNCDGIHEESVGKFDSCSVHDAKNAYILAHPRMKKKGSPNYKTQITLGGDTPDKYYKLFACEEKRKHFVKQSMDYLDAKNINGLNFRWNSNKESFGFVELLKELRFSFDQLTGGVPSMMISVTIPCNVTSIQNLSSIAKYCDFVNVLTHDYNSERGAELIVSHAPLEGNGGDNISTTVKQCIMAGVPKKKLVITIPCFGRTFISNYFEFNYPAIGNFLGPVTNTKGMLSFHEISEMVDKTWNVDFDESTAQVIAYKECAPQQKGKNTSKLKTYQVIVYDNKESIKRKVEYVHQTELAGVGLWTINTDEFLGGRGLTSAISEFI